MDDAIVVIENIDRHAAPGDKSLFQASVDGTKEIFLSDFAGTITTLTVLVPIMFVGGYAQKILRPLTVVLISGAFGVIFGLCYGDSVAGTKVYETRPSGKSDRNRAPASV